MPIKKNRKDRNKFSCSTIPMKKNQKDQKKMSARKSRKADQKGNTVLFEAVPPVDTTESDVLESPSHSNEDQVQDSPASGRQRRFTIDQPYICKGNFEEDFTRLCQLHGLEMVPSVLPWPCPPERFPRPFSLPRQLWNAGRRKSNMKLPSLKSRKGSITSFRPMTDTQPPAVCRQEQSIDMEQDLGQMDFIPTTFTVKDQHHLSKPRVQVDYGQSENSRDVMGVYIRNWKVDKTMMNIFEQCLQPMEHLRLLHLWNVGLTSDTIDTLAACLPRCHCLTTLVLDANPLGGQTNLSELISEFSPIENLSLRFCSMDDRNTVGLGFALGTTSSWNKKLLTLNLSNNRITDVGVRHIARGLMSNRTLLALNLAGNQVGDEGAATLAEVLSHFPLDPEQLKFRRWMLAERERTTLETLFTPSSHSDSSSDWKGKRKDKDPISYEKKKTNKEEKVGRNRTPSKDADTANGLRSKAKEVRNTSHSQEQQKKVSRKKSKPRQIKKSGDGGALVLNWHPMTDVGSLGQDGRFWIVGNRSLLSLNLARNQIQEEGLKRLLDMLQAQCSFEQPRHLMQQQQQQGQEEHHHHHHHHYHHTPYGSLIGLRRLVLHRNRVPANNTVLMKIQHHMYVKDPLYKKPLLTLHRNNVSPCAMPPIAI